VKLPVPPELFAETVRGLPGSGYRGANVTIPHKVAALEVADSASAAAQAIGAANTLTFGDGRIEADNTDAGGLIDALDRSVEGLRALVLGAGGAGRAAAWALREEGADVAVWNRTPERAAALAAELGVAHAERPRACEILVNATSVGLDPATPDADALEQLGLGSADVPPLVADLVYRGAGATPLETWAERAGAAFVGGLEVLVRQGARSLESWTGRAAPLAVMRAAAVAG
jgi:shikimate dehydrogenase